MPIKRRWKYGLTCAFLIVSLCLLLIPYRVLNDDLTYKDPHGGIGLPKGSGYGSKFFLPMITTSQSFYISFNLSEGLVSIYIFTTEQYYEYEFDLSFQPLIQIANITEFEGIIPI